MQPPLKTNKSQKSLLPKISLKWVLIIPFVAQIVGAVGLVGYFSYRSGEESINQLTKEITTQTTKNVVQYLDNYLATPVLINRINADSFRLGNIPLDHSTKLEQYLFYTQLQQFPTVSHIMVGTETGVFQVANRNPAPSLLRSNPVKLSQIEVYKIDQNGNKTALLQTIDQFNLKKRPWYETAVKAGKPLRVPIFQLSDNTDLSLNSSHPIYDQKTGKLLGVFSAASDLTFLRKFIANLQVGRTGQVFIMERNGLLIGTSTPELPFIKKQQNGKIIIEQIKAIDSKNLLIKATRRYLLNKFSNFNQIKNTLILDFLIENKNKQIVQIVPYKDKLGLDWLIVVVVPETDFIAQIQENNHKTILLCLLTFCTATGLVILTARRITRPILQISKATESLAKGEFNQPFSENQIIKEIQTLATSFNVMLTQVHQSFERVEIALKESKEKYKTLFETFPIGISITDTTGKILESNPSSEKILGISNEEQNKRTYDDPVWQIIRPDGSEMPVEEYASVRALKENCFIDNVEMGIIQPHGHIKWISVSAVPIPLSEYGVAIAYIDITERKKAEQILLASETRYRQVVEQQTDFILRSEPDTTITFANESLCFALGCTLEQILGQKWLDFADPNDLQSTLYKLSVLRPENPTFRTANRDRRGNGQIGWTEWINQGIFDDQGQLIEIQSVGRDITDLKKVELALRESDARWQLAVEGAGDGTWDWNPQTNEVHFSKQWKAMLGYEESEISNHLDEWVSRVHPEDLGPCYEDIAKYLRGETKIYQNEHRMLCKNGTYKWILDRGQVIERNAKGEPIRFIGTHSDISDRKITQLELQKNEAIFRRLSENIPGMIYQYIVYADGRDQFTYMSQKCLEIYEIEPKNDLENSHLIWQLVHPEDAPTLQQEVMISARELQRFFSEHRLIMHQGQIKWIQANAKPQKQPNGDIIWDGLILDISERKKVEIALQNSETRFQKLASSSPGAIYILAQRFDGSTYFEYVSSVIKDICEVTSQQILENANLCFDQIHPDDRPGYQEAVTHSKENLLPFQHEWRIITPSKKLKWVQANSRP
jgi:PAS domain S-box-containing protein